MAAARRQPLIPISYAAKVLSVILGDDPGSRLDGNLWTRAWRSRPASIIPATTVREPTSRGWHATRRIQKAICGRYWKYTGRRNRRVLRRAARSGEKQDQIPNRIG